MAKARRTTHRSSTGTKLYAVRAASGEFKDIQTYKRAQGADIKKKSQAEKATAARSAAKKTVTKPVKKTTAKRTAKKR